MEGAQVFINGRTQESVDNTVKKLKKSIPDSKVSGIFADFSKVEEVNNLIEKLPDVDILIKMLAFLNLKNLRIFPMRIGLGFLR